MSDVKEVPGVPVPIPDDDPRKDYRGMYRDLADAAGEDEVDVALRAAMKQPLKEMIERLYDNLDEIEREIEP